MIPAGTPMPTPVPPGRFAEFAAAISEGFCPSCRRPFDQTVPVPDAVFGFCHACGARWELSRGDIGWHADIGEMSWDIWTKPDAEVPGGAQIRGTAVWAE